MTGTFEGSLSTGAFRQLAKRNPRSRIQLDVNRERERRDWSRVRSVDA